MTNIKLEEEIDKHLKEQEENKKASDRDYFYVSELLKSQKDIYKKIKEKKVTKFTPRVKRILDNGNSVHERYMKYFAEMGLLVAAEINAVKEDFVHGRLDCIITDKIKNYVVEIKSCSMWVFNKLVKPMSSHELQTQFYMYYTGIEDGILLYENKDNQNIKTFNLKLNKKLVEGYISKLKKLKEDIFEKNIIPPDEKIKLEDLEYEN